MTSAEFYLLDMPPLIMSCSSLRRSGMTQGITLQPIRLSTSRLLAISAFTSLLAAEVHSAGTHFPSRRG